MVCVPCIIIPLLLYIWHRFVLPILLRYWNPWEKKDAQGNVIQAGPEFPFECKGGVCPYVPGGNKQQKNSTVDGEADDQTDETIPDSVGEVTVLETATVSPVKDESKKLL